MDNFNRQQGYRGNDAEGYRGEGHESGGQQQQPFKEQGEFDSPYGRSEPGKYGLTEGSFGTEGGFKQQQGHAGAGYEQQYQGYGGSYPEQDQSYGGGYAQSGGYQGQEVSYGKHQGGHRSQEAPYGGRTGSTYAESDTFSSDLSAEDEQRKHKKEGGIVGKIEGALGIGDHKKHEDDGSSSSSDEEDTSSEEKKKKHHFL